MSPYKDEQKREYQREYMKKKRSNKEETGLTEKEVGLTFMDVIPKTMPSGGRVTPTLLEFLVDKEKRRKLESICMALDRRELGGEVRFGVNGVTFNEVEELLLTTA